MAAVLIVSLLLRHMMAMLITSRLSRCEQRVPVAPSVPSHRSSHDGVAHCFASFPSQPVCACGAVAPLRLACRLKASLIASLLSRRKRRVHVMPSVPLLRSSHDGVAHCFAFLTSHDGAAPASLLSRQERRVPVAPSVPSLRSTHDGIAHCFASLALQTRVPLASSVPSLRLSHDGVAHCLDSPASQTTGACGIVGSFASLVARRRRSLFRMSSVANDVCLWCHRSLRLACHLKCSEAV